MNFLEGQEKLEGGEKKIIFWSLGQSPSLVCLRYDPDRNPSHASLLSYKYKYMYGMNTPKWTILIVNN
jgi:hypothetical protein